MGKKIPQTDRSCGGPGSSHEDATEPKAPVEIKPHPGEPTNTDISHVSGGGGERDRHHSHDPSRKA